jgi:hypothetical protein
MLSIGLTNKQIILKGLRAGFQATLTSSFIYASLVALFMVSLLPINMDFIEFFGMTLTFFLLPFVFAILPNLVAGVLIVWILNKLSTYLPIYTEHAGSVGGFIGFVWSIGIAVLMASFIFGSASSASIMWYLIIVATGTYCGALVGYRFIKPLLEKQQKALTSAGDDSVHFTAESQF